MLFVCNAGESVFSVAGVRLSPEMDELLRTHTRTSSQLAQANSRLVGHYNGKLAPPRPAVDSSGIIMQ